MSALASTLVVVWIGTTSSHLHFQPHLRSWAAARGVRMEQPQTSSSPEERYDAERVQEVERQFEQARLAAAAADMTAVRERLTRARELVLDAPQLPQAAWLLAEVFSLEAELLPNEAASRERAQALEGRRALAFGSAEVLPEGASNERTLRVNGLHRHDVLIWDGEATNRELRAPLGLHHVRVMRGDTAVYSGFHVVGPEDTRLDLPVALPAPCSQQDIGSVQRRGERVLVPAGVQCPRWAAAAPGSGGDILVSTCHFARCGPLVPYSRFMGVAYAGPPQVVDEERGLPGWAHYALIGAASIALTSIGLWQAGVFDGPEPPRTVWRYRPPPE